MIKTDDLYLENLKEFVYDDKKVVTYKFLSVYLGVHVNLAKQMLYTFRERERRAGRKIYSLLYVSGLTSEDVGSQGSDGADTPKDEAIEKHVILLCKDSDFDSVKEKFSKLLSVHVYCISAFPVEDYASLQSVVKKPLEIDGHTPAEYGPYACNTDLRPSTKTSTAVASVAAPPPVKVKEEVPEPKEPEKDTSKKPADKPQSQNKAKNFFGTQSQSHGSSSSASKTGTKKTGNQSSIQSSMSKMKPSVKAEKPSEINGGKNEKVNITAKSKSKSQGAKSHQKSRKRIRMNSESDSDNEQPSKRVSVFTSSEDEDAGSDDFQGSPQSKRNNRILSSDSEDESIQASLTVPPENVMEESKASRPGKKRVMKTIDKTFMDKDGYLVTKKETVMVSENEDDNCTEMECDVKPTECPASNSKCNDVIEPSLNQVHGSAEQKNNDLSAKKVNGNINGKTSSVSNSQGKTKTKQASIMNFFQKK